MKINNQEPTVSTKNEEMPEYVNVTTVPAVVFIPDNTIKLEISAQILNDNDDVINVVQTLNTANVVQARIDGSDWECEFGEYVLTDKAREELNI